MFGKVRHCLFFYRTSFSYTNEMNNTIVVYASRHGTTKEYARKLLKLLDGNVDLCSLDERANSMPDLSDYNTIVIGGSIHYGKNSKLVLNFANDNIDLLKTKRLGLFVTSHFDGEKAMEQLQNAYPRELLERALVVNYFDGELLFPKMNFIEKMVAKLVLKADEIKPIISKPKITDFANKLNELYEV